MAYSPQDAAAIRGLAARLGVSPGTLTGLFELESGGDPNIWGGAGGNYRGLIQFGPGARKEVGLPSSPMTVSEQLPYVEKYFQQRGFTPGKHGARELYRTVLVGNPHQSGTDSWGTNSDKAAARMLPGGDLYERGSAKLGLTESSAVGAPGGQLLAPAPGYQSMQFAGSDPALAALAINGIQQVTGGAGAGPLGSSNPLTTAALGAIGAPLELAQSPSGPIRMAGLPSLGGVATDAINSLLGQSPQFGQSAPAMTGSSPGGMIGEGTPGGPMRVGRVSHLGEDPLPSTGPHLDVRIQSPDGTYINPKTARSLLANLKVDGKPLYSQQGEDWQPSFPVTSGWGPRAAPTAGASTFHKGVDYGVAGGASLEWHGPPGRFSHSGGIGVLELPGGHRLKLLHTMPG